MFVIVSQVFRTMAQQFSKDGTYFAEISTDGKIKIWNTLSNSFEQEYTPNFHLTSPCTCLHFIQTDPKANKAGSPRKKKRRGLLTNLSPFIVLGTSSGLLLIYSIAKADVEYTINSNTSQSVSCLSSCDDKIVYSGAEQNVIIWDLEYKSIISKWKAGNEKITAILIVSFKNQLLTASKNIKLWDIENKEVLRTFTGHSSEICFLQYVHIKKNNSDIYFISGSKGDRLLACWNLSDKCQEKNAIVNFLMEDVVENVSINVASDGSTNMATTNRNGAVHIFKHTLNGKCNKPLKPKTTIQVVADSQNEVVTPIHIIAASYRDDNTLCIGYGSEIVKIFENITVTVKDKIQCLVRKDPRVMTKSKNNRAVSKVITPHIGNDVHYLTLQSSMATAKRKSDGQIELPMEKRLENLTLNKIESEVPKGGNLAQLLVQGLHSKDKNILKTVLMKNNETVIKNTIKRLPMTVIVPLVEELKSFIMGKTIMSNIGLLWMRNIVSMHASVLLSNPDLMTLLSPILGSIESRIKLQSSLHALKGRLDLLVTQVTMISQDGNEKEEALLVYNDRDFSDSDNDIMEIDGHSESENEWEEDSSGAEESSNENQDDSDVLSS